MNQLVPAHEQWLGSVAAGWRRSRVRNEAILSPGMAKELSADEICTFVPMEQVSESGVINTSNTLAFEDMQSSLVPFEAGDVIFAKITPCMENGKGAHVDSLPTRRAYGSTEFHVLRPLPTLDGRFLYYYTFNPVYRAYAAENMTGAAGQKRVSSRFLKDTRLFMPPIDEQKRIAAYLDASCHAIDAAVAAKRGQLQVLDELRATTTQHFVTRGYRKDLMKAEISYLGFMPKSWHTTRLKQVAEIRYGLGQPPAELDGGLPMIRATNVDHGEIRTENLIYVDPNEIPEGKRSYLKENEIIVVRSGAYTGDSAIVPKKWEGAVAGYDMVASVNRASPKFVAYVLLSKYMLHDQIIPLTLRAAQPHLNAEELGSVLLVLPSMIEEQEQIVSALEIELQKQNKVRDVLEKQINTLTAHRKSLIHECVTGQRRITDADVHRVTAHAATLA